MPEITPSQPVDERRRYPRMECSDRSFKGAFRLEDGTIGEFQLVARNVSRGGIAVIHSRPIKTDALCDFVLPTRSAEVIGVHARVRACRNLGIMVHEIGVQFDEPLDKMSFAELAIVDH